MTSFNFNGVDSASFPWLLVNRVTGSLLPSLKRRYITVPGREGAYHAGRDMDIRVERIKITVLADSQEELAEKKRILAEWLDTEQTAPFFYSYEPDKVYQAVLSGETDLEKIVTDGETELIFEMPDPYATSTDTRMARLRGTSVGVRYEDFTEIGTGTDVVADASGLRLAKEGQDYSNMVDTDWESGTHNGTTEAGNEFLQLAKSGADYIKEWASQADWEDPANIRDGMGSPTLDSLMLEGFPMWEFMDDMSSYTREWRVQSPSAGGEVLQRAGYVTIRGSASGANFGIDTQLNDNVTVQFPCTIYILYRGRNSSGARFIIEDGTTYGYTYNFEDEDNEWNHYWIRAGTTEAIVYKNGAQVANIPVRGGGAANQIQFDIQNGGTADYDIGAIYADWGFDKGAPPASGWSGTWETPFLDLSSVGIAQPAILDWIYRFNPLNPEEFQENPAAFADVRIEYKLRIGGVEQDWKTIFNDPTSEGAHSAEIPDIPMGTDLSNIEIKLRVAFHVSDPGASPRLEMLRLQALSVYHSSGHWDSPVITGIQQVGKAAQSEVAWEVDSLPAGTSVKVYVRHRLNSADPWGDWLEVVNSGDPFPGIDLATDLSSAEIQYRIELTTTDIAVTPSIDWLRLEFFSAYKPTGQWLSPAISLAPANVVGDSSISWTGNGQETIQVEARLNGGAWQPVENGGEIPGARGTQGATLELRVTLSTADLGATPEMNFLEVVAREKTETAVTYSGTAPGKPKFYIDVAEEIDEIRITHLETGQFMLLQGDFRPGDQIIIDHADESVTLNDVYRLNLVNIKSRFFKLTKGTNNFIVAPEYGVMITMEWAERWK